MLPAAPGGKEIIAESMLWLLMTGKVPTEAETRQLSRQLAERGELPDYVVQLIDSYVCFQRFYSTGPDASPGCRRRCTR